MNKLIAVYRQACMKLSALESLPALGFRLALAYGLYKPAKMKWEDISAIGDWFASLNIPAPHLNAYLAAGTEALGVVLLLLGLGTRLIALPLMITMLVAIKTVHWANGFDAGENGFEIPLYYLLMLFYLFVSGAGKWSLDFVLNKRKNAGMHQ